MLSYSAVDFFTFLNKSGGGGDLSESVKKWKFMTKTFFVDLDEWNSKCLWKMISVGVKAKKKKKKTLTLWPLFMDGVQLPQG